MLNSFHPELPLTSRISYLNWRLIFLITVLASIGFLMLYSAAGGHFQPWLARQLLFFSIFFVVMICIAIVDIRLWYRLAYLPYFLILILLVLVDIKGHSAMGAERWLRIGSFKLQPSEIMKVAMIFALAKYFYNIDEDKIQQIRYSILPVILIIVPTFLIFDQPDLGTATILAMVGAVILFVAGMKLWKFIFAATAFLIAIPFLWIFVLYDYQKERVINFLNPDNDPSGSGYNIIQSKIAIGSGGFLGKGFMGGSQGQLDFLPEKQTDFIFTMLSEELGFVGALFTIGIYLAIIYICGNIALQTRHHFGRLIAIGIMAMFFIHMFVNMGMTTGILPVVGAPLPLISYGGTITATMLIGFGLVLNVDLYKDVDLKI